MHNRSDPSIQGRAAIFNGPGKPFEFISRNIPEIKSGEILVKNLYTTLCGSDIHTYCGRRKEPPQVVLGHEIVGEIVEIGKDHKGLDIRGIPLQTGDTVIWSIFSVPPGSVAIRADIPQKSSNLYKYGHALAAGDDIFNGGLAEYCILREDTALIKISADIPLKVAATISCAHATVMGALRIAGPIAGKSVMISGAGLLGITCIAMCREAGASRVGIMDLNAGRLEWSRKFGADFIFQKQNARESAEWPGVDIVFDMTGNPEIMRLGVESLNIGGVAVWIGAVYPENPVLIDAQQIVRKIIQIRGLHNYNYEDLIQATVFIERNYQKYPYEALIEKEYVLNEIERAFEYATDQQPVRVGINMSN